MYEQDITRVRKKGSQFGGAPFAARTHKPYEARKIFFNTILVSLHTLWHLYAYFTQWFQTLLLAFRTECPFTMRHKELCCWLSHMKAQKCMSPSSCWTNTTEESKSISVRACSLYLLTVLLYIFCNILNPDHTNGGHAFCTVILGFASLRNWLSLVLALYVTEWRWHI